MVCLSRWCFISLLIGAFPIVERYEYIHCYLDNDNAGHKATDTLTGIYPDKTIDENYRYQPHNDLNDILRFGGK